MPTRRLDSLAPARLGARCTGVLTLVLAAAACAGSAPVEKVGQSGEAYSTATWVDGNVSSFRALRTVPGVVYVLGTDGNLWREVGSMTDRTWVDGNVRAYQPIDGTVVYVLGTNGNLWREVGSMATRTLVASGVSGFQAATDGTGGVYYVDANADLWRLASSGAPTLLASEVRGYQWVNVDAGGGVWGPALYVLRANGALLRASELFAPTSERQIDANLSSFQALDGVTYYSVDNGSTLWSVHDTSSARSMVDTNVESFVPLDGQTVFVEDDSFNLWREEFTAKNRDLVDASVKAFQPMSIDSVYVLRMDGNLYLESLAAPACTYSYAPTVCTTTTGAQKAGQNADFVAAWGVVTASGTCPEIAGYGGAWQVMVNGNVPDDTVDGPPPSCAAVGLPSTCCLYVWQPTTTALQDPSVLCSPNDVKVVAYDECGTSCPTGGPPCAAPGGGGCPSCLALPP